MKRRWLTCLVPLVMSFAGWSPAMADEYGCFSAETTLSCQNPLESSASCLLDQDYSIQKIDRNVAATTLAIHGGSIELHTGKIAAALSTRLGWNLYEFKGHGTPGCLGELKNPDVLHITSTHFDEPQALELISGDQITLSIHGYAGTASRDANVEVLCVGGKDRLLIGAFEANLNRDAVLFAEFTVQALDAKSRSGNGFCRKFDGDDDENIVNRNARGAGMQLELSLRLRQALASSNKAYDSLRDLVYGSIQNSLPEPPQP